MKVPVGWLKDFVAVEWGAEKIADTFNQLGLNVEAAECVGNEFVLDLETPSNRSDVLGVFGCAREFSAFTGVPLMEAEWAPLAIDPGAVSIEIADRAGCHRYAGLLAEVTGKTSPGWVQQRLEQCGLRPINGVVDLTNYVLLELGQPLHAFDWARVGGRKVVVRRASKGEKLKMLDGVERALREADLVIADASVPMALAGVMGGEPTGVNAFTKSILLESAYFHPPDIRHTAKAHGLSTDASYRFERDVDPEGIPRGVKRFAFLLQATGVGKPASAFTDFYPAPFSKIVTGYRSAQTDKILGFKIPVEKQESALKALGFSVQKNFDAWKVGVPSWRRDVSIEEDLVEEVVRINGYHLVPDALQDAPLLLGKPAATIALEQRARGILSGFGLTEIMNMPLLPPDLYVSGASAQEFGAVPVLNPISQDHSFLRPALLPGMLQALNLNQSRGVTLTGIFEIGRVYFRSGEAFAERRGVAIAVPDRPPAGDWRPPKSPPPDFFTTKGIADALIRQLGAAPRFDSSSAGSAWFHPGRQAQISLNGSRLGWIAEIHPAILRQFDLDGRVSYAEIVLESLLSVKATPTRFRPLPIYPSIARDMAIVAPYSVLHEKIEATLRENAGALLESVELFDAYTGAHIPHGHRSLAYHLVFRHPERTLSDEDVTAQEGHIIAALKNLGLFLRET
ncbi:MAG: phenylalanine--tRNA ligase subunit beta [bacterium]